MKRSGIDQLVFFGGTSVLTEIVSRMAEAHPDLEKLVFTAPRHVDGASHEAGMTVESFLKEKEIPFVVSSDINNDPRLLTCVRPRALGFSYSAPWIFRQNVIDLFGGRLLNMHETRLPRGRGGAPFSWALLMGVRDAAYTIHWVSRGIDEGAIVQQRAVRLACTDVTPAGVAGKIQPLAIDGAVQVLESILRDEPLPAIAQADGGSEYWPRLYTPIHGHIDWRWSADDIARFVGAFSEPYQGAITFLGKERVHISEAHADTCDGPFHPFQAGLIYRRGRGALWVAAVGGALVVRKLAGEGGRDIMRTARLGDRMHTPLEYLERALATRIFFDAKGVVDR